MPWQPVKLLQALELRQENVYPRLPCKPEFEPDLARPNVTIFDLLNAVNAVLKRINVHARIPLIGLIAQYNDAKPRPGPNLGSILTNRALIQGMIIFDHVDRMPDFLRDMSQWLREGKVRYREDIVQGLENAPRAFIGLLQGENIGKRIVQVAPDPTRDARKEKQ